MSRRACLTVRGSEATSFLQNLVTCEVADLDEGALTFGGLLSPQGKILFDFFVLREPDGLLIETLSAAREALITRLNFYKLRAQVVVSADPRQVAVGDSGAPDPRSSALPQRSYGGSSEQLSADYDTRRIELGIPEAGMDFAYGDVFPHDVLMDQFETSGAGVEFTKGCYVGQEVVSRMQHRGTARRRPIRLELEASVATGAPVTADEREIGFVGTVVGKTALAIVRIDRARAANTLSVGGAAARWNAPFEEKAS